MNRIQKISWFMVVCIGIALILGGAAVVVLYARFGFPKAYAGLGFLGLAGIGGLGPLFFGENPGAVQEDERDAVIRLKAARAGFALSYGVFILLGMGIWAYRRWLGMEEIAVDVLPLLVGAAGITAFLSHAVAVLVLYGGSENCSEQTGGAK